MTISSLRLTMKKYSTEQLLPQVYGQSALVHVSINHHNSQAVHYEESEKMYLKAISLYEEMYGSDTTHADIA